MHQVLGAQQKAIKVVCEIAGDLLHPRAVGVDTDAGNLYDPRLNLHHEEDQMASQAML